MKIIQLLSLLNQKLCWNIKCNSKYIKTECVMLNFDTIVISLSLFRMVSVPVLYLCVSSMKIGLLSVVYCCMEPALSLFFR